VDTGRSQTTFSTANFPVTHLNVCSPSNYLSSLILPLSNGVPQENCMHSLPAHRSYVSGLSELNYQVGVSDVQNIWFLALSED
jgi:hypothetical protein